MCQATPRGYLAPPTVPMPKMFLKQTELLMLNYGTTCVQNLYQEKKALRNSARSRSLSQQTRICLELSISALNGFCSGHCRSKCPEIDPSLIWQRMCSFPIHPGWVVLNSPISPGWIFSNSPILPGWILSNSPIPPGRIITPISPDWRNCCCSCTRLHSLMCNCCC